jgi:regulator of protease activity HflC (stomatin/prohibitin superfamily)
MRGWTLWAGAGAVVVLLLVVGLVLFREPDAGGDTSVGRYTDREVLMPGATFRFPPIEEELQSPHIRSIADPEEPLSPEQVDELKVDSLQALYSDLNRRVEHAVEERLFED